MMRWKFGFSDTYRIKLGKYDSCKSHTVSRCTIGIIKDHTCGRRWSLTTQRKFKKYPKSAFGLRKKKAIWKTANVLSDIRKYSEKRINQERGVDSVARACVREYGISIAGRTNQIASISREWLKSCGKETAWVAVGLFFRCGLVRKVPIFAQS